MWMAELAERSGVAVPTIKFYLREGLLPRGEARGRLSVAYGARNDLPIMGTDTNRVWLSRMSGVRRCGPGRQAGGRRA